MRRALTETELRAELEKNSRPKAGPPRRRWIRARATLGWIAALRRARPAAILDWAVAGLVLLVVAVAQLVFRQGPQPFDPAKYFQTAVDFPDAPADHWTLRIGLVAPVRLAVLVFGPSEAALYAVPFAAGLLLAGAVYGTMLLLFRDRLLAAAAALVTALSNDFLLRSGAILPDTAATATFTAGIFLFVLGARQRGRTGIAAAASAGVLFGLTYLIREFSPILLPVVVAAGLLLRCPLRRAAVVAGAAVATAALELVYGLVQHGDPLVHVRLLLSWEERPSGSVEPGTVLVRDQLDSLLDTLAVFPRLVLAWDTGWALLGLVAIFLVALVVRFRDRRLWLLGAWAGGYWLAMALLGLGSLPSGRWLLNITSVRYWFPLFPALVMGAFAGIGLLLPRHRRLVGGVTAAHAAAVAAAALFLGPGLAEFERCADREAWPNDTRERWYELRSWFATPGADEFAVLATDPETLRLVPAFTSTTFGRPLWRGTVTALPVDLDRYDVLVLVHRARLGESEEPLIDELTRGRVPVFASGDGEMILLAGESAEAAAVPSLPQPKRAPAAERGTCGTRPYAQLEGVSEISEARP
jgi:hypothetical protein